MSRLIFILALLFYGIFSYSSAHAVDAKEMMNLEIEASKLAVSGNLKGAIDIYSKMIGLSPTKVDAYLERGLLYRELGENSKSMTDAAYALQLVEALMSHGKQTEKIYYQRATANRLLQKYDLAVQDLKIAIQKSRSTKYNDDLQAIILESKMK